MKGPTKLQVFREFIEDCLDAGMPFPTNRQLALAIGREGGSTKQYGLGGRFTYEKQKIKIERGIATPADIEAFRSKLGTYEPISEADQQLLVIEEIREERAAKWGPRT